MWTSLLWAYFVSAMALSTPRRPRAGPQQAALPLIADLQGVVHERARLPHLPRRLGLEQAQQGLVVDDLLHEDGLRTASRPVGRLEDGLDVEQTGPVAARALQ